MNKKILTLALSIIIFLNISSQVFLPMNSTWKYFRGTTNPSPDNESWKKVNFDDNSWLSGIAPFRFGDSTGGTVLSDMRDNYTSVFIRKIVSLDMADTMIGEAVFRYIYDDGFRVFINGIPVVERNAPVTDAYNSVAPASREYYDATDYTVLKADVHGLKNGNNTIVVAIYNSSRTSSDLYFDFSIEVKPREIVQNLPRAPEVQISVDGGYYNSAFNVTLSSPNAGDTIKYTFNYSEPEKSSTALTGISPFTININSGITGRPATPGVVLRASVIKHGYLSRSETRTYIFTEQIKTQKNPGGNWPAVNTTNRNIQFIDYDIDSRIVNDSRYSGSFSSNFLSIPTVSIVTENPNLFDPSQGIYMNAMNRSELWEKPASMELINTDNTQAFSVNMGLRIRGGYSRNDWNPKHGFRIFMEDEYGKKKLEYPLFGEDAAQEFKKFDLRCAQNYSWSFYNDALLTYAQDEFCRDVQGLMGQPHTRSRYCHLFLNGMYWGLYEFQERPESNFAASYIGGKEENFDVVKVAVDRGMIMEATDGTMTKYQALLNLTNQGFSSNANYYKLQGLNSEGKVDTTLEALADVDNLIDYMINIFYSGNFDAPLTIWGDNNRPNNIYCIKNRNHTREGFIFIVHDAEHTLHRGVGTPHYNCEGVNQNRVNLTAYGMYQPDINNFTPQWLHHRLTQNGEYKQRFQDKVQKYFYNNGLFTPAVAEQNFRKRANQISDAIISESARWGDSNGGSLRTKDNDWIPAVNNTVNYFIKLRTPIVLEQLKEVGLVDTIAAPEIYKDSDPIVTQSFNLTTPISVSITDPDKEGVVYYTLHGADPRLPEGKLNPDASQATENSSIAINSPLILKARILEGTEWGPLREILFTNKNNRENLRITEIQYNPGDYGSQGSKDIEFIEIKNIGDVGIDLGGLRLDSAIRFKFPEGTIINPHGFVVIASEKNGFEFLYKIKPTAQYSGNLSNDGDRVVLIDENNNILIDAKYGIIYPWPINVNGSGYSLVSLYNNPVNDPDDANYWHSSKFKYGSPFSDDSTFTGVDVKSISNFTDLSVYPVPSNDKVIIEGNNIKKFELFDLNGRLLKSEITYDSKVSFSFSALRATEGLYILKIYSTKGITIKKVVYKK